MPYFQKALAFYSQANYSANGNANIYSYGNTYTWAAAIADTTDYTQNNQSIETTSICPSGWHLPKGGSVAVNTTADYYVLAKTIMNGIEPIIDPAFSADRQIYPATLTNNYGQTAAAAFRTYPNNITTYLLSSTTRTNAYFYILSTDSRYGTLSPGNDYTLKQYNTTSVRCVADSPTTSP